MEYKIIEKNEEDINESVIGKIGKVIEFTMAEIDANTVQLLKLRKELDAKVQYEAARMTNVEQHHPFVLEMSEEDLFTAHMYQEAKAFVKAYSRKLEEVNNQIAQDEVEVAEIKRQIPELVKAEEVKPAEAVEPAEINNNEEEKSNE